MRRRPAAGRRLAVVVRKLPYYARSLASLARVATARSIAGSLVTGRRRLELRDGTTLRLSTPLDVLVVKETLVDDVYGLRELVRDDGVVIDVGAGIGEFAIEAARRLGRGSVVSFEPNPLTFRLLQENVRASGLANVTTVPVAIGTEPGYLLGGLSAGPRSSAASGTTDAVVAVEARTLDDVVPRGKVCLLKIDCEGLEGDVLRSGARALARVERVVLEYHRHLLADADRVTVALLTGHGFVTRTRPDRYEPSIGYVYGSRGR